MISTRVLVVLATLIAAPAIAYADLFISITPDVSCDGVHVDYTWNVYVYPDSSLDHPEWVGYDVYRRETASCGPYVRLNAEPYPRRAVSHAYTIQDTPPSLEQSPYDYYVATVDADRVPVWLPGSEYWSHTTVTCPNLSGPVTVGTVEDYGWALYLHPCQGSCWPLGRVSGSADALRVYAGTGTVLRCFGRVGDPLCAFEGCALVVSRFELASCGVTPTGRVSWGRVKAIYR
jgi:hypothetical protein